MNPGHINIPFCKYWPGGAELPAANKRYLDNLKEKQTFLEVFIMELLEEKTVYFISNLEQAALYILIKNMTPLLSCTLMFKISVEIIYLSLDLII